MKTILFSIIFVILMIACSDELSNTSNLPPEGCVKGKVCKGDIFTQDLLHVPAAVSVDVLRLYLLNKQNIPAKSPLKNIVARVGGNRDFMQGVAWVMGVLKINPIFALSLSALESKWGMSQIATDKFNLWGWQAYDGSSYRSAKKFSSFTHGFSHVFSRIKHYYLREEGRYYKRCKPPKHFEKYVRKAGCSIKHCGASLAGMNCKYSSDNNWAKKIRTQMNHITEFVNKYCYSVNSFDPYRLPHRMMITNQVPRCG